MNDAPRDIVDTVPRAPKFTAQDRCDTCGAQAWARAKVNGSELLFCMHHWRRSEYRLILIATDIDVDYDGFTHLADGT